MGFLKDKKKIFIFDRGYPSLEFIYKLIYEENVNFVFRLPKSMYKKEKKSMTVKDAFIDLILTHRRIGDNKASKKIKNEFRKLGKINIRITTVILENGKEECLISNLPMNKFTQDDLKEIYKLRWEIEYILQTLKKFLKN
jgi:IS4 transposase